MSDQSPPGLSKRISSRMSRFRKRISSVFSPSPPVSASHHRSTSSVPVQSAANLIQAHPSSTSRRRFTHDSKEPSAIQSYSSTYLAPPPFQILQGQASIFREASHTYYGSQGMLSQAHNFVMKDPVFIDNNTTADNFMEKLLEQTIFGAEYDSSDRDPPPRCHPGTRLAILQRCLDFIVQCHDKGKLRWVVGPAGVGKSAVMQMVAEKAPDDIIFASIFLSVNGRREGSKTFITIAFQLAVKWEPYYHFIRNEITRDPSLLRKSLSVHFRKFIIEPFVHQHLFDPQSRFLVLIDGLDECDSPNTQQELLELISDFCITYPASPIAWIVASRPEPHITSFFARAEVQRAYEKEEMQIDSDEACKDVQRYLREELRKIQLAYATLRHKREWPSEIEFTRIATAAGGLFAYAATVVRFIGDPHYGDPPAQLRYVLEAIDASPNDNMSGKNHPMAQLDALYMRILSNIPDDVVVNTRKLLLLYSRYGWPGKKFRYQCNILGLTEDAAYGAIRHLHAVVRVPQPETADEVPLVYFHKSFEDFLFDFKRSGFSDSPKDDIEQLRIRASLRIIEETPDDSMDTIESIGCGHCGYLKGGAGVCDNISLSWPGDERFKLTDDDLRLKLYRNTMLFMCDKFSSRSNYYGSLHCFHALTTRFSTFGPGFPLYELRDSVFDNLNLRSQLVGLGKLSRTPLRSFNYAAICGRIKLQFTSPTGMDVKLSDPWNPSCKENHTTEEADDLRQRRGWVTQFDRWRNEPGKDVGNTNTPKDQVFAGKGFHRKALKPVFRNECDHCLQRFSRHFHDNREHLATVFVDSTEMCYVEFSFMDADDGVSEWRYLFLHSGAPT